MQFRCSLLTLSGLGLLSALASHSHAQTLTDVVLFDTNAAGTAQSNLWNTRGGDSIQNVYLRDTNGNFINSGNGANTAVSINMTTPGDYLFFFAADDSQTNINPNRMGVNLFFDGQTNAPQLSAKVARNDLNHWTNGAATKDMFGNSVAGANTLTFDTNGNTVTLDVFTYARGTLLFNSVSGFNNVPNFNRDMVGVMRLSVQPVPAPGALATAFMGAVPGTLLVIRKRRRMP
jgi:hypothetical protein